MLAFDPEWLAITRAFAPHMSVAHKQAAYPAEADARAAVAESLAWVRREVFGCAEGDGDGDAGAGSGSAKTLKVRRVEDVQQFVVTAPRQGDEGSRGRQQRE